MWVFLILIALLFVSTLYRTAVQSYRYGIDERNICSRSAEEKGRAVGPRLFLPRSILESSRQITQGDW